jgi:hypothetical protein
MENIFGKYFFHQFFENKKLHTESMAPYSTLFYLVFSPWCKTIPKQMVLQNFFQLF